MRAINACLAIWLVAGAALAQDTGTNEPAAFPVERLRPALDRSGIIDVETGAVGDHLQYELTLWGWYALNPLTLSRRNEQGVAERVGVLVGHRLATSLVGALSLFEWIQLGAELPVVLYQGRGTPPSPRDAVLSDLSAIGLGDLRLVPKIRLLRRQDHFVDVAMIPAFTVPTSLPAGAYFGESFFTFVPELAVSTELAGVRLAANAGLRFRPQTDFIGLEVSHELLYRAGVGYSMRELLRLPLEVNASVAGATSLSAPFSDINTNPLEILGQVAWDVWGPVQLFGGAGWGLIAGFGTPDLRLFGGVRYGNLKRDRDGDGIPDHLDACPDEPEDFDGYLDSDGCPDPDNDGDGILDVDDRCPDVAGLPEYGGCPADDIDGDGIPNHLDKCPEEPEDFDGFEDEDGCPDPDNDGDGILDVDDECPDLPGLPEDGGCPPEDTRVVVTQTRVEILETIHFETDSATIKPESFGLLRDVAKAILQLGPDTRVRIEGHTDSVGPDEYNLDLSQRRAESVRRFLIGEGVAADRVQARGYGKTQPIATNDTAEGRARNRRVVFRILAPDE